MTERKANLTLLVLAAGMGSRYGGLKQVDPIGPNGETILDYSIFDAQRAGFNRIVFVLRREIERQFRETIGNRIERRIATDYVFQQIGDLPKPFSAPPARTKPWGTTHAVLAAANIVHEPFVVINADDFYGAESYSLLANHLRSDLPDSAMAGFTLRNTLSDFGGVSRGVCQVDRDGFLEEVIEWTSIERSNEVIMGIDGTGTMSTLKSDSAVSMNMWAFTPAIFGQLEREFEQFLVESSSSLLSECYLPATMNSLILTRNLKIRVLRTPSEWFGITYREDKPGIVAKIYKLIDEGVYPRDL